MLIRSLGPLLAAPILLSGCLDATGPQDFDETPIEQVEFASSLGIDLDDFFPDESGVWLRDDEVGIGDPIVRGQSVGIYYRGWLSTGEQYDAIDESDGPPPEFVLGTGGPIAGMTIALVGMRLGGERTALVPPSLGFGWASLPGIPPAGSWLVLDIRLVSVDGQTVPPSDGNGNNGAGSGSGS
ncbi:hypothetical protein BH23GEM11_BH23GEM11_18390 [soil metagenome]